MRMNGSVLTLLLVMLGSAGFAQSSVGALGRASDRAQQVFDGRTQEPADTVYDGAVVGGGQLARMMAPAATAMGVTLRVLVESDEESASLSSHETVVGLPGDAEAVRAVRAMPSWIPARMNGKPVATRYVLPINFVAD